jgi:hypothetical protein
MRFITYFTNYYNDQIKEDQMGGTCSMYEGDKCVKSIGRKSGNLEI